jgi:hypothetical protein
LILTVSVIALGVMVRAEALLEALGLTVVSAVAKIPQVGDVTETTDATGRRILMIGLLNARHSNRGEIFAGENRGEIFAGEIHVEF